MKTGRGIWMLVSLLLVGATQLAYGESAEQSQPPPLVRDQVAIRLRLGLTDKAATDWSGSARVTSGRLLAIDPWPPHTAVKSTGNTWQAATRRYGSTMLVWSGLRISEAGVILHLGQMAPDAIIEITTRQGQFRLALADLTPGRPVLFLKGAAEAERIADTQDLVITPDDEDFPSAATAADGPVYLAYMAFTPGSHFGADRTPPGSTMPNKLSQNQDDRLRRPKKSGSPRDAQIASKIRSSYPWIAAIWSSNLSEVAEPTGGDRVWLLTLKNSQWSKPVAITDGGEDLYRTAIAVDGQRRAWIFFSKNVGAGADLTGGDWELFARSYRDGAVGPLLRLTHEPGPDIYPAAATDAEGRVWVTWQAFRNGKGHILAARQEADGFGKPLVVAEAPANAWCPAIAATASQPAEVTIAWDTYAKGDYDVYARTFHGSAAGEPFAVAATRNFEARPAVAYDGDRRLWLAWEQTGEKWGKDFGGERPLETKKGVPLYLQRELQVRVLHNGQWYEPAGDLGALWPRMPTGPRPMVREMDREQRVSFARLGVDRSGRVWLAGRLWMGPGLAQNWHEYVTYVGAKGWAAPIFTVGGVKMLDKRSALVSDPDGGLLLIGSGSGRQRPRHADASGDAARPEDRPAVKPGNNNLYVAALAAAADAAAPRLVPTPAPVVAAALPGTEPDDVRRVRAYRAQFDGKSLRVLRGEFHRHTELSGDGGADGSLEDMWRYALDAASLDWLGNGDHYSGDSEYPWWLIQKTTTIFQLPGVFTPMYSYERNLDYPDGHRNVVFTRRGVRPLMPLADGLGENMDRDRDASPPPSPDTQMLYRYLRTFNGVCASHTSGTGAGTDWRNSDREVEPIVEIYQGDRESYERPGGARAPTEEQVARNAPWKIRGFVNMALLKGIRLGFECSSDHFSTHTSFCNVYVEQPTRENILAALRARHVYGSTDHIVADVRWTAGGEEHFMGDEFTAEKAPTVRVHLEGTAAFAKVSIIKDNSYVYTASPNQSVVDFTWTDREAKAGTSYYYLRGEQADGELVWVSPVWIHLP